MASSAAPCRAAGVTFRGWRSILEKEGLPPELAYLPLIESGFRDPGRVACGCRRSVATHSRHRPPLRPAHRPIRRRAPRPGEIDPSRRPLSASDLHDMFGDWHLSLAAYNTGEGNISRILEKGQAGDFWEMSDQGYLYQETEDFVPEFLAALHIAETPEAYGFEAPEQAAVQLRLGEDGAATTADTVARLSGASSDEIKELNPALHRGVVPPQGYAVRPAQGHQRDLPTCVGQLPKRAAIADPAPHREALRQGAGPQAKPPRPHAPRPPRGVADGAKAARGRHGRGQDGRGSPLLAAGGASCRVAPVRRQIQQIFSTSIAVKRRSCATTSAPSSRRSRSSPRRYATGTSCCSSATAAVLPTPNTSPPSSSIASRSNACRCRRSR